GFADADGAIHSRETIRRVRELVGTVEPGQFASTSGLRDELAALLFHAVIGTSRLPVNSLEAPLPAFLLGQLGYVYRDYAGASPLTQVADLIDRAPVPVMGPAERARLLEVVLRNWNEFEGEATGRRFLDRWGTAGSGKAELLDALRAVFNDVSLSPYLGLVSSVKSFIGQAVFEAFLTPTDELDFFCHLLRQTGRHLTAFDLVRFHHRGANYPDALLIDEVLRHLCGLIEFAPELILPRLEDDDSMARAKRLRRRGLRQAWLVRGLYYGHRVPDTPTTPGENARVWPLPQPRIPDEQILNPATRTRSLFDADWSRELTTLPVREALRQCVADLANPDELRELGMALFLDRPFGADKHPAEPDRTLLFSYEAFSRRIALDRLARMAEFFGDLTNPAVVAAAADRCRSPEFAGGVAYAPRRQVQRPGVVSLDDSVLAADDLVFLRCTRRTIAELLCWYDTTPLAEIGLGDVLVPGRCLLLRVDDLPNEVRIFDANLKLRGALKPDLSEGYVSRAGVEHLAAGLVVTRVGGTESVRLRPRLD
ncbi:MAG: hypothetical protein ACJ8F7_06165, partial [Gemmataceae bacterium]